MHTRRDSQLTANQPGPAASTSGRCWLLPHDRQKEAPVVPAGVAGDHGAQSLLEHLGKELLDLNEIDLCQKDSKKSSIKNAAELLWVEGEEASVCLPACLVFQPVKIMQFGHLRGRARWHRERVTASRGAS